MNQNRNRRRRNNEDKKKNKVIRCKVLKKPVFEHEVCSKFCLKVSSNNINSCENCEYSF